MIPNREFKPLSNYSQLIKQLEFRDKFDKYSICKNFYELLTESSKESLFRALGYDDKEQLLDLLDNIDVYEVNENVIKLGSDTAYIEFKPDEDKLRYAGSYQENYRRKYC